MKYTYIFRDAKIVIYIELVSQKHSRWP